MTIQWNLTIPVTYETIKAAGLVMWLDLGVNVEDGSFNQSVPELLARWLQFRGLEQRGSTVIIFYNNIIIRCISKFQLLCT